MKFSTFFPFLWKERIEECRNKFPYFYHFGDASITELGPRKGDERERDGKELLLRKIHIEIERKIKERHGMKDQTKTQRERSDKEKRTRKKKIQKGRENQGNPEKDRERTRY